MDDRKNKNINKKCSSTGYYGNFFDKSNKGFYTSGAAVEKTALLKTNPVNTYYTTLSHLNNNEEPFFADCFAVRLCLIIIDLIRHNRFTVSKQKTVCKKFYAKCTEAILASTISDELRDTELIEIYVKQLMHILREQHILSVRNNLLYVDNVPRNTKTLYRKLFNSFWNKVSWENIFPSSPDAARELQVNRSFFKDILLKHTIETINTVINNFVELTGFCDPDDLFMISFIDFYLITWLKHFGIVNYAKKKNNPSIFISVTSHGKKVLSKCIDVLN